jgi:uncharacterized protein (DUF2237 family)
MHSPPDTGRTGQARRTVPQVIQSEDLGFDSGIHRRTSMPRPADRQPGAHRADRVRLVIPIWPRADDPGHVAGIVAAEERALAVLPPAGHDPARAWLLATIAVKSRGTHDPGHLIRLQSSCAVAFDLMVSQAAHLIVGDRGR